MPAPPRAQEALSEQMKALSVLVTDEATRQGLRVLLREGRRCGYDSMQVAGVTLFSSHVDPPPIL